MYNYSVALTHSLKGTILNVNENFVKWVCNKTFIQFEYIKNNLIRQSEAHKIGWLNAMKISPKKKAPKIIKINTGKYMINQPFFLSWDSIFKINRTHDFVYKQDHV
jgi:hypothetical protein